MGIRVTGVGAYLPDKRLTNYDLAKRIDTSHEWISSKTGIVERRISAPQETPSDMACQAALRCLKQAGVEKESVDLIVVACSSPDQIQPAVACLVQAKLGIAERRCPAFDVNSVCTGFVVALSAAQGVMHDAPDQYRHALVVGTDAYSKILNWDDRRTCVYFGDGAGAVVLSQAKLDNRRMHFRLGSDGRGSRCIGIPAGGTSMPVDHDVMEKKLHKFTMDGPLVWDFAVSTVPRVILQLLSERNLSPQDVDLFILHQSNLRMIESIMRDVGVPMHKTVTTVETCGNTAAASIPITLAKAVESGRLQPGNRVVICGFGGGLSWGAGLLEW